MLDHVFLTVNHIDRSLTFYEKLLPVLGISARHDYDGADGPAGHPDLKGFGAKGVCFFGFGRARQLPGRCTSAWWPNPRRW